MCLKAILKYTEFGILILSRRTFLYFSQQGQKDTNHARDVVNLRTDVGGRVTGLWPRKSGRKSFKRCPAPQNQ